MMVYVSLVLAEGADISAGPLGWVTAGTSVGLLGPILYWVFYVRWPANDRLLAENQVRHDAQLLAKDETIKEQSIRYDTSMKEQRNDFRDIVQKTLTHCEQSELRKDALIAEKDRLIGELQKVLFAQDAKVMK